MAIDVTALVRDLKSLRKGRGLLVGRIGDRVGPNLRHVCKLADSDSQAEMRRKLADRLLGLANNLPADLRLAVLAAFGLHADAQQPFYQDRLKWAAAQLGRDERTVRRRVDVGIEALAELAVSRSSVVPRLADRSAGWHTKRLWVSLSLDLETPEAIEHRRIVADRDNIGELDLSLTLTAPQRDDSLALSDLGIDVFRGGALVRRSRESSDRLVFNLALPQVLMRGETHDYVIRFRVPPGQAMQPHYVCVPRQQCETLDLSVRFPRNRLPRRVWRLVEAFQRDVDDPLPHGEIMAVDPAGEVHLTFDQLRSGLAYGVRWEDVDKLVAADAAKTNGYQERVGQAHHQWYRHG